MRAEWFNWARLFHNLINFALMKDIDGEKNDTLSAISALVILKTNIFLIFQLFISHMFIQFFSMDASFK